ncbi:MAG: adenosylhopane nucleosidase [Rhizobiales bacterium]|nr:adenosylhopane nucleosidase [Hyphomicrobiales bacterium]
MPSRFSWSWPSFNVSPPQAGWRQGWRDAWRDAWREAWSETWSGPEIDLDGRGAASVRSLSDPDSALDLNDLSQRSVIALVGLAFEARIAAGPGVLVVCRGHETADLLRLAIGAGCRSIISFGVAGGLAPDLLPGDCVVASAIIDYPAVRPAEPLWSRKLAEVIPDARHGPIMGVNSVVSDPADKRKLHAFTRAVAVDMESHLVARLADAHGLAFAAVRVIIDPAHRAVPPAALLAMAPGGSTDLSAMLREILARPSQVSPLMRLAADAIAARAALVRLRRALGPSFSWE